MQMLDTLSNKKDFVVNVLSLMPNEMFSPVQIQKLFFLLEKKLALSCFNFKPYHYGPYDKELTEELELLNDQGKIQVKNIDGVLHYQIDKNYIADVSIFLTLEKKEFIKDIANFIKNLSFKELCMSIYQEYPEMAEKSVFFRR